MIARCAALCVCGGIMCVSVCMYVCVRVLCVCVLLC